MNAEWTVAGAEAGVRLDKFLAAADRLGSRGRAASALERGKVLVNGVEAGLADASRRLVSGDVVRLWADRPGSARPRPQLAGPRDLQIVYEDEVIVVLDKPAGLLSVPLKRREEAASVYHLLEDYLRRQDRRSRPFVVHRIDRDTSGLVLFAKHPAAQEALKTQFRHHQPERVYWAAVHGHPQPQAGTWRDLLVWDQAAIVQKRAHPRDPRAKEAVSEYRVTESFHDASTIEVRLRTGKRNQIRIQACLHGHVLIGERLYVPRADSGRPPQTIPFARQALHAQRLGLRHPGDGRGLRFEAPLPADLRGLLERLRSR